MKTSLATFAAVLFVGSTVFAADPSVKVIGRVKATQHCAESKFEVVVKGKAAECLGFDGIEASDLVLGVEYTLEGYRTEDGLFVRDAKINGRVSGRAQTDAKGSKFIRSVISGSVAQAIYAQLDLEETIARGPGGGQAQKSANGLTCVNDPADGYSCILDFGKKGLE